MYWSDNLDGELGAVNPFAASTSPNFVKSNSSKTFDMRTSSAWCSGNKSAAAAE